MKTPEEILMSTATYQYNSFNGEFISGRIFIVEAMKKYAKAVLEEAKFNISLRETNEYTTPDIDNGFAQGIDAAMESIEIVKGSI